MGRLAIVASVGAVMGVAVWAYQENDRTQAARDAAAASAEMGVQVAGRYMRTFMQAVDFDGSRVSE
jgi:hypothetical protein